MSAPIATATARFKGLLANALERVCVLEEELEVAQARIRELEAVDSDDGAAAEPA
jgi:hypothetical protein